MAIDPMDLVEQKDEKRSDHLNSAVAVAIALLAAFMGICSIKDGNIVQNMQQAQAKSIDSWNYYQAKNIREDVYQTTADEMNTQSALAATPAGKAQYRTVARKYEQKAAK